MYLATRINSFIPNKDVTVIDAIYEIGKVEKLTHVDLNYPEHFNNVDIKNLKKALNDTEIKVSGIALRFREKFINGELGNTDEDISKDAIKLCKEAVDMCKTLGGSVVTIWLGYDGFDYSFQLDYPKVWGKLVEAFKEIADYNKEIKISIEYKPFQPRAFSMISSIGSTLLMINDVKRENLGVTVDYCHMLMKGENPAFGLSLAAQRNKLYGIHINDGYGLNDDGLMVGSVSFIQTLEFIYYLKKYNYNGVIYFDTFPVREKAIEECKKNVEVFKRLYNLVDQIGMKRINEIIEKNDAVEAQGILLSCLK